MDSPARRNETYFAFIEAANLLQALMEEQTKRDGGISYLQFVLLARLAGAPDGRMRMTDLADSTVHSRSGLSYQGRLLEDAGLIERVPSTDDERSVTAVITETGHATLERVLPGHVEVVEQGMFSVLDDSQLDALSDGLTAVRDRLRTLVPSAAQRRKKRA
ncbi:MarR family winged helix-turn-helix transcriptional regulator [Streptomyces sp. NBC_00102]|uniref:MarR family winged helix-turn-helix transcriptional regulator n=1 Tax=Streptomyces sp. NBC_00102 TaxID=2975652 RepID=UPI0022541343|nr:MarR family transcriptional regulator [Streptomyces sp. NBC_00102]MCX5395504.1 MarR family transcriptional regulator [Streptomyces sp. NBC_00102]